MANNAPIGVFDSGIGGLTVVNQLMRLMPNEDLLYFGDTARTPYGSRPPAQILEFMHEILRFFQSREVKAAVMACNTMTALGLESARKRYSFPIVGMNTGVRTALKITRNKTIGVIATQATIASGKHGKTIKTVDPTAAIYPQPCPKFVPLIERGQLAGKEIEEAAMEYLEPMKEAGIDVLILGCTHYPFILELIRQILGPEVEIVDPAIETAKEACNLLDKSGQRAGNRQGKVALCFSADLDRARRLAQLILTGPMPEFRLVKVQDG